MAKLRPRKEVIMAKTNHRWTEEEREIVRRDYKQTTASTQEIGRYLSMLTGETITEYAVKGQIAAMGIAKVSDRKPWTAQQDRLLRDLAFGPYCPRRIAKMMNRTLNSVVVRMKRLGLYRRIRNGWYTKKEVCELFGVDHKWVQRRIDSGALKAAPYDPDSPGGPPRQKGGTCWCILEEDLIDFIRRFPHELNARNVDLVHIVHLLAGLERMKPRIRKKKKRRCPYAKSRASKTTYRRVSVNEPARKVKAWI